MADKVRPFVTHTPTYDKFETVTLGMTFPGGEIHTEMLPRDARHFADQIIASCVIVEEDEG